VFPLLRYMVTNSRRASVSIVAGSVKEGKTIHRVSSRPSAFEVSLGQSALEVRRQCSTVPSVGSEKLPVL
jgi:hypothetical protein